MTPTTPVSDDEPTPSIDEILQDFADGIAAEEAWVDAKAAINQLMYNEVMALLGDDEVPPVGEQGKFDPQTRTYELITDSPAVKYHIQRVMNRNGHFAQVHSC
jgi:hypothetical protein